MLSKSAALPENWAKYINTVEIIYIFIGPFITNISKYFQDFTG